MNAQLESMGIRDDVPEPEAQIARSDLKAEWLTSFNESTNTPEGLAKLAVPTREPILGSWFKQGDLGFIYGARGLGKTWLAMHIARKCAEGGSVSDWEAIATAVPNSS